jgi:hypothetical protein
VPRARKSLSSRSKVIQARRAASSPDSAAERQQNAHSRTLQSEALEPTDWEREIERSYGQVLRGLLAVARSRERAEDAMQEAILAALQHGPSEIQRLDAWLYVVGVRKLRRSAWKDRLLMPLKAITVSTPPPDITRLAIHDLLRC